MQEAKARRIFESAAFVRHLGIELVSLGAGACETRLVVRPEHLQQDGFVHAGVQATMADHSAGVAAATTLPGEEGVLSIEFKLNLLRPAVGERLRCVARVLRAGRTVVVAESEVFAVKDGEEKLVSKLTATLAVANGGAAARPR